MNAQAAVSLSFLPKEMLDSGLPIEGPSKTLIRLRKWAGWSESFMGAYARLYLVLDTSSCQADPDLDQLNKDGPGRDKTCFLVF